MTKNELYEITLILLALLDHTLSECVQSREFAYDVDLNFGAFLHSQFAYGGSVGSSSYIKR
jgi:hypothetical protein